MQRSPSAASTSNGPGSPMLPLALSQARLAQQQAQPGLGDAPAHSSRCCCRPPAPPSCRCGSPPARRAAPCAFISSVSKLRDRERRQPAGERRLVRRRQVLVDALGDDQREMRVDVGEARHHHLAAPVDELGGGVSGDDGLAWANRSDFDPVDRDGGAVVDRVTRVHRDDRSVVDDRRHC